MGPPVVHRIVEGFYEGTGGAGAGLTALSHLNFPVAFDA
jgi:hypothetical protein